jgi:hypothetical protein
MPPGIEERRLADGSIRYAVRVRRRGQGAFGVFETLPEAIAYRATVLADLAAGRCPSEPRRGAEDGLGAVPAGSSTSERHGGPQTVADAARELIEGMVNGVVRDNRGRLYKPASIRKYEEVLRLHEVTVGLVLWNAAGACGIRRGPSIARSGGLIGPARPRGSPAAPSARGPRTGRANDPSRWTTRVAAGGGRG